MRTELAQEKGRANAFPLPFQDDLLETDNLAELSLEDEFARIVEQVFVSKSVDAETACLALEQACKNQAEKIQGEARENMHRSGVARDMETQANELKLESQTWRLLWHLSSDVESLVQRHSVTSASSGKTSREIAASLVQEEKGLLQLAKIIYWLESMSQDALNWSEEQGDYSEVGRFAKNEGLLQETKHAIERGVDKDIVTELDPDAASRQHLPLAADNMEDGERLMKGVWKLIRCGCIHHAADLCCHVGEYWRASSLLGSGRYGGLPVGNVAQEATEHYHTEEAFEEEYASEVENGRLFHVNIWKWTCFVLSKKLSESGRFTMEAAVYAVMCGFIEHILPACESWEDILWAYSKAWLDVQIHCQLSGISTEARMLDVQDKCNVGGAKAAASPTGWPVAEVMEKLPGSIEEMFANVSSFWSGRERQSAPGHFRKLQEKMALGKFEEVLLFVLSLVFDQDLLKGEEPGCGPILIRFAAHLGLWLLEILSNTECKVQSTADVANEFGVFRDSVNRLVQIYIVHLIENRKNSLIPVYALHLRRGLLDETYCIFLDTLSKASFEERQEAVHLGTSYLSQDDFSRIIRKVTVASRMNRTLSHADYVAAKIRSSEWICMLDDTHAEVAEHACLVSRELALLDTIETSDSLAYFLHEVLPEDVVERGAEEAISEVLEWKAWLDFSISYSDWRRCGEEEYSAEQDDLMLLRMKERAEVSLAKGLQLVKTAWLQLPSSEDVQEAPSCEVQLLVSVGKHFDDESAETLDPSSFVYLPDETKEVEEYARSELEKWKAGSPTSTDFTISACPSEQSSLFELNLTIFSTSDSVSTSSSLERLVSVTTAFLKGELMPSGYFPIVRVFDSTSHEIAREVCRRVCIPRLCLKCLQLRSFLCTFDNTVRAGSEIVQLAARGGETGISYLFSTDEFRQLLVLEQQACCAILRHDSLML